MGGEAEPRTFHKHATAAAVTGCHGNVLCCLLLSTAGCPVWSIYLLIHDPNWFGMGQPSKAVLCTPAAGECHNSLLGRSSPTFAAPVMFSSLSHNSGALLNTVVSPAWLCFLQQPSHGALVWEHIAARVCGSLRSAPRPPPYLVRFPQHVHAPLPPFSAGNRRHQCAGHARGRAFHRQVGPPPAAAPGWPADAAQPGVCAVKGS